MKRRLLIVILSIISVLPAGAQSRIIKEFRPVCDTLNSLVRERTTIKPDLKIKAIMKRGNTLDFYFTVSLSDIPWRAEDRKWFIGTLKKFLPPGYRSYNIGEIYTDNIKMKDIVTGPRVGNDGKPQNCKYRLADAPDRKNAVVRLENPIKFSEGLDGRNIAIWQSHGMYYNEGLDRWKWQRPCLFTTVEDLYTQSYVLPFIVPMLENAGAYVMLPRERDYQTNEMIVDNDPGFAAENRNVSAEESGTGSVQRSATAGNRYKCRTGGTFSKSGKWVVAGPGFADTKEFYGATESPFLGGTALKAPCTAKGSKVSEISKVTWTPKVEESGEYAVYVSYKTLPNSSKSAHYTVHHAGGQTGFFVNQTMGGGLWIYLGTFRFEKGEEGYVELDNIAYSPSDNNAIVTADAVKIGGGYGNIERGGRASGMPRFTEGARYWLQWAGADSTVFSQNEGKNDYKDDFMSRGDWVAWMSGGSKIAPKEKGRNIPFDLAFALHSDAGVTPNDSTIGTLAIYTLKSEGRTKFATGESRHTSREYADMVQSQITDDIRALYDSQWNRRMLWNRGYRESRTPTCPTMLCELLSHQNFADMKLGLDPAFRFTVSRAIYKGMLKYLANRYGTDYTVQPLPVERFSACLTDGKTVRLSWREREDGLEPTASADGFILETRIDGGGFDNGRIINEIKKKGDIFSTETEILPGHIYSFRVRAYNKGGKSFPSETLSAGIPEERSMADSCVLIVNNFDRVSAPAWIDTPSYAGFDGRLDGGVPYMKDAAYCGEMYEFRRQMPWLEDDCPGHGASYNDFSGTVIAGNTFDYPYIHGKAIMAQGYPFCSASASAFCNDTTSKWWCADMICGKQARTISGKNVRHEIFTEGIRKAIERHISEGGNLIVSGANIGTDVWDSVHPVTGDSAYRADCIKFITKKLGYRWVTNYSSRTGEVLLEESGESMVFNTRPCPEIYRVETPDGIAPAGKASTILMRYADTGIPAAVGFNGTSDFRSEGKADSRKYKVVSFGFPIETLTDKEHIKEIIESSIKFFRK